ncbi:MAG: DUF6600 domain-containing protein [Myxococcota bacterium]
MRRLEIFTGCVAALILSSATARASDNIDEEQIHAELDAYGSWVDVADHGPAWRPDDVDQDWRPYTRGHWERQNDAWLWVSDLSWGRIPFHYGRWLSHANYGWVWVPGRTWAPAWVLWSDVEGYSAWAPLPPGPVWQGSTFVGAVPAAAWCFAPAALFGGTYVYFRPYWRSGWVPRLRPYRGWGPHFRRWSYPRRYSYWGRSWKTPRRGYRAYGGPRRSVVRGPRGNVVRYSNGRRVRSTRRVYPGHRAGVVRRGRHTSPGRRASIRHSAGTRRVKNRTIRSTPSVKRPRKSRTVSRNRRDGGRTLRRNSADLRRSSRRTGRSHTGSRSRPHRQDRRRSRR